MRRKAGQGTLAAVSIIGGFLLGSIILLCTGRNPLLMFRALFMSVTGLNLSSGGFNPRYIGEFVIQVLPILLTGLSVGFAFRAGHFNIGAEGQLMMGAVFAAFVALGIDAPAWIHVPLCMLAAMAGGALWGAIPGFLKAFFNVHEVVVTIMLNYVGIYLGNLMILYSIGTVDRIKTAPFPPTALLKSHFLEGITAGSRLNWAFIPAILAVAAFWIIMEKTSFGYGLRSAGFNKEASRASGLPVKRDTVLSLTISGAFAGMAGAVLSLGTFGFGRYLPGFEQYGYDGIAVALVGANAAPGIFLSSLLFGALKAAGPLMQLAQIPREIGSIISSSILLFIAMELGVKRLLEAFPKKRKVATAVDPAEGPT